MLLVRDSRAYEIAKPLLPAQKFQRLAERPVEFLACYGVSSSAPLCWIFGAIVRPLVIRTFAATRPVSVTASPARRWCH